jgi:hypothetical protein
VSYRTCVQGVTADEIDIAATEIEIVYVEWDVEQQEAYDDEEGEGKGVGRPQPPAEPPRYGKGQGKSKGASFDSYVQRVVREATAAANFANAAAYEANVAASTAIEPIGGRRVSQRISGAFGGESQHDVIPIRRDTLRDICESIDDAVRATEQARRILESGSAAFEEQQRRLKSSLISLRRALEDGRQA